MNEKELKKIHVINSAIEGKCTVKEASELLGLSERRIKQLKKEVRAKGPSAVIHASKGIIRPSLITKELQDHILSLKKSALYIDANFSHFRDLLEEYEGISISYASLYRLLSKNDITSCKKHRKKKLHHWRKRKAAKGMLLQADGTPFDWFSTGRMQSLHGFIDDATGMITGLYMCENECLMGYLEVLRQTLLNFGIPMKLYPDKAGIFFVNNKKLTVEEELEGLKEPLTQFGRIVDELGIEMQPAHSPQAKGRIERLWQTLQSRLYTEFKINNISTIEQANDFLPDYIKKYNQQFSVVPESDEDMFMPLPKKIDLDLLLSVKYSRKTDEGGVISFQGQKLQVVSGPASKVIKLYLSASKGLRAEYNGKMYEIKPLDDKTDVGHMPHVIQKIIYDCMMRDMKVA